MNYLNYEIMAEITSDYCSKSPQKTHELAREVISSISSSTGVETDANGNVLNGGAVIRRSLITYTSTCIFCNGVVTRTEEK